MVGLGEEREESTKHTNEHVIKKMGPHSLQRLHQEGAYLKCCFLLPLPLRRRKPVWHLGAPVVPVPGEPGLLLVPTALPPQNAHFWVSAASAPHTKPPEPAGTTGTNIPLQGFNWSCGGQGLICASPRGRGKREVIKIFVSLANPILEVESVKEISP